jgi:beta-fructofuranosidase
VIDRASLDPAASDPEAMEPGVAGVATTTRGVEMHRPQLLYRPADGWLGDVIPYAADGTFHVFYIFDDRDAHGPWQGLDWAHVTTKDFVTFEEQPIAIPRGRVDDLDLLCGTGSVTRMPDGRSVIHYAGINPSSPQRGMPEQVVLRAHSDDLVTWTKDPGFVLVADERWYERDDWRDPFLYQDAEGLWRMLLCARVGVGPRDRRGTFGLATSPDLEHWTVEPPVLTPGTTNAPECPDLFVEDGDAYLLYASYSDRFATRYRRATSMDGPWRMPTDDALEAPDVYAMKTASDGERRYLMGWLSTRSRDRDAGHRQWGGDLVVHELVRRPDGELGVAPPETLVAAFSLREARPTAVYGDWLIDGDRLAFGGHGLGWLTLGDMDATCLLDVTVDLDPEAEELAIVLRADAGLEAGYYLRLEPRHGRFVFDRRPHRITIPFEETSDRAYVDAPDHEIERPLRSGDGLARVRVITDGSAIISYVNDVALSTRGYDRTDGVWGLVAAGGAARFDRPRFGRLAAG